MRNEELNQKFKMHRFWQSSATWKLVVEALKELKTDSQYRDKKYTVQDTNETHRTINFWESEGLIDNSRDNDKKWRKFSFCEILYIFILRYLRDYGISIERLKTTKQYLFGACIDMDEYADISVLETAVYISGYSELNLNSYLIVLPTGETFFMTMEDYIYNKLTGILPAAHILININQIIKETLDPNAVIKNDGLAALLPEEYRHITEIRSSPDGGEISVKTKNHQITLTKTTRVVDLKTEGGEHTLVAKTSHAKMLSTIENGKKVRALLIETRKAEKVSDAD